MVTSKREFLEQLPLFAALTEEELDGLAAITREYEFEDGAVIAYQRDVGNSLYVVKSGRLFARAVDAQGIVRDSRSFLAGDYFGEEWLFTPNAHPATVKGKGNGRVLIIQSRDFLQYLDAHRDVLDNLEPVYDDSDKVVSGLAATAWEDARKIRLKADRGSTAVSLLPDELVEYLAYRSRWYLLLRLLTPGLLLFLTGIGTFILLPLRPEAGMLRVGFMALPLIIGGIFFLWLVFNYLDWRNDYFVITNKRLIHREFDLRRFSINVVKIPIEQIQSVEISKPNLLSNLFNYGTARVSTAAQAGTVYFDNIDDPRAVKATLNALSERVKTLDAGREQAIMRDSLESHFHADHPLHAIGDDAPPPTTAPRRQSGLRQHYRWRVEEGDTVTYRKHLFVLLRQTTAPVMSFIGLGLLYWLLTRLFGFTLGQLWIIFSLLLLGNLGWLIWQVEDWSNDMFQVTNRVILDIDRRPFGFGESRKQAPLSNIQNVSANRPGLLQTIFDFGTVYIETAGADANITFEDVPHPSRIQSDIFKRIDEVREAQRVKEGAQRRKEYAVLLDVYKQATEQGRIPQRTPPPGESGYEN